MKKPIKSLNPKKHQPLQKLKKQNQNPKTQNLKKQFQLKKKKQQKN